MSSTQYLVFCNEQNAHTALHVINNNFLDAGGRVGWFPEPEKSPGRELWFFPKPADEFMEGLGHLSETFTFQPFNPDWRKTEN